MYLREETIPTVHQFRSIHPDTRFICQDFESLVVDREVEIQVREIQSNVKPPTTEAMLKWDSSTATFKQMGVFVSAYQIPMYMYIGFFFIHVYYLAFSSVSWWFNYPTVCNKLS